MERTDTNNTSLLDLISETGTIKTAEKNYSKPAK